MPNRILWADDEIDQLEPHLIFLKNKGFDVTPVTNGEDAISLIRDHAYDLVFLDEQMPGMDGLATLNRIKTIQATLPVVMITKSEEESIMEDAIGGKISDYLIKPVNPNQILLTIKRILERRRIRSEKTAQKYLHSFKNISEQIHSETDWREWIQIYKQLTRWDIDLQAGDESMRQVLNDQYKQANHQFGSFIEEVYPQWLGTEIPGRPPLSVDVAREYLFQHIRNDRQTLFIVIDCMRYGQWVMFEDMLTDFYNIDVDFYYSILPTATPYSRNSIFAGLYPSKIAQYYPGLWQQGDDEESLNKYEEDLLAKQLKRDQLEVNFKYEKILNTKEGAKLLRNFSNYLQYPLITLVYNFVDTLVHTRSDLNMLKEIAPDVPAFRSLTQTWFRHSALYEVLKELADKEITVVITTDHGAVHALTDTKVRGDRETSTSLRYKYGRNLRADPDATIIVEDPEAYNLPLPQRVNNYLIAKEDYYFVYPTNYNKYKKRYRDTFLHGGASMEEMILPIATMTPK